MSRTWPARSRRSCGAMQLEQAGAQPLRADALPQPAVSIVIPVFNESASIPRLHTRLHQVLQQLGRSFEVVYVDDGSTDRSLQELLVIQGGDPAVKVVTLARNAGQHAAVLAGFAHARGAVVVTLDADLQNPPEARLAGRSRYSPLRFMQLGFDLMTGFSLVPIQLVSLAGLGVSLLGIAFGAFLLIRRLILGPESEGLFTLFAILFVFVGILIFAVGLVGEYVGRIYAEVRRRPPYIVRAVYPADPEEPCASS